MTTGYRTYPKNRKVSGVKWLSAGTDSVRSVSLAVIRKHFCGYNEGLLNDPGGQTGGTLLGAVMQNLNNLK